MIESIARTLAFWCSVLVACIVIGGLFVIPVFFFYSKDLPDYNQLAEYDPPTISRIYTTEGDLMAELAKERRIFTKINEIPQLVIDAFLAAEDHNYYNHPGIDVYSIVRAATQNALNAGSEKNPVGGSTITQQVVKNFLLTNERTLSRKIKEAILAYRINKIYSKDRILELYLNQIYLGNGAYGVTSAALNYFNKDLSQITVEEAAMMAAMPKAPSLLDATRNPQGAKSRRDWVIERMNEEGFITGAQARKAKAIPIKLTSRFDKAIADNGYYTEAVRLELLDRYGFDKVYEQGLSVFTNIDPVLQKHADEALRAGLIEYDRRHGYKGAVQNIKFSPDNWKDDLKKIEVDGAAGVWKMALVLSVANDSAALGFRDGSKGTLGLNEMKWARKRLNNQYLGKKVETAKDVVSKGDVIYVSFDEQTQKYALEQIPDVNGALVAMEPYTGKVVALVGGYSFKESKYNRAIQAYRQPGSTFKPFVYLAALEKGYSPISIVQDSPISISQGPGLPDWTPKNMGNNFLGPITMRTALEKSRNLATIRVLLAAGVNNVADVSTRFNIYNNPPKQYSMALGAFETTLMQLTAAYATFASDGMRVEPKLIDRIHDRKGRLIYYTDSRECVGCKAEDEDKALSKDVLPTLKYQTKYLVNPEVNYQMVSMLQGVVDRGTAARAKALGKTLAGKTGTSNDSFDAWFVGFSPDLVCGVYVGYDNPKTLGDKEFGANLALPIFTKFMGNALQGMPDKPFTIPDGIQFVSVDAGSGKSPSVFSTGKGVIKEALRSSEVKAFVDVVQTEIPQNMAEDANEVPAEEGVY